ncbi:DUF2922 domain-containing protein [Caryophanon latum]|uniref:DUF2922 domain-containing protein n=1 Tax=Caryophanon latum TaxID=33977 RepID=A0A1C0YD85_9BACL|nr:DUF2922 domain-containing protein [Caryophanon latum]OCS85099.1 hypothetical protein A6K76_15410 [Caryophanon latum]
MEVLELVFTTPENKTKTITIEAPVANVSEATVRAAMEQMIASDVYRDADSPIQAIKAARYVSRTVTPII